MIGGLSKSASGLAIAAVAGLFAGGIALSPASAAGLGGDCCADLEERVAELEATTARKGNRVMSLTVSGQVNRAILYWDDGENSDIYSVGNENSGSRFRFKGSAKINSDWSAGYMLEIDYGKTHTNTVSQINDDGNNGLGIRHDFLWVKSKTLGTFYLGQTSVASDGAHTVDLSGAGVVAYTSAQDWNGGFFLRRSDRNGNNGITRVTWSNFGSDLDASREDVIRYDTPTLAGFTASVSFSEDDNWAAALRFANEFGGVVRVAAAIGYRQVSDENTPGRVGGVPITREEVDNNTLGGSISMMHIPTGLNVTFAMARRSFDHNERTPGPVTGKGADDQEFWYVKAGIYNKFFAPGKTAIYGEYGVYTNGLSRDDSTTANLADLESVAGTAAEITGSEATVWGLGIVQKIDAAAMELYVGYRHYTVDVDLIDAAGASVATAPIEDFDAVLAGARIKF